MNAENPLKQVNYKHIAVPVIIGITASLYLLFVVSKFDTSKLSAITLSQHLFLGLALALLTVLVRDLSYIYRIWKLTDEKLSFRKCLEVILLWEFGSSVTPASVGGITLALYILNKEKISLGKGTAIILLCSYLDNIAFVIVFSILYFLLGSNMFDLSTTCPDLENQGLFSAIRAVAHLAWIGFLVVAIIGGFLGFAIFIKPDWANHFFQKIAQLKWLHRWKEKIAFWGEEISYTSKEFKSKGTLFVAKVLLATILSWCARYALANALIWTFATIELNQLDVFARQYVHRVLTMIPTTPGGSGVAEVSFMALNCDFLPQGLASAVSIVWRLFNFYLYLLLGVVILPRWLARVGKKNAEI